MNQTRKEKLFRTAQSHFVSVQSAITKTIQTTQLAAEDARKRMRTKEPTQLLVQEQLLSHYLQRLQELAKLHPSPYFIRCLVEFPDKQLEELYFASFSNTAAKPHVVAWGCSHPLSCQHGGMEYR